MFGEKKTRPITRRRFVQGATAGAALAAYNWSGLSIMAETIPYNPPVLSGKNFELTIDSMPVNFTGRPVVATAVNGSVPGPILRWREGDTVTLAVTNRLKVPTSIHWHSLRIPSDMDGVPGLSFPGIAPRETFHYRFPVLQHGTAWYHGHSRFQEQTGLIGPLIIDPRGEDPIQSDREYVIFLSDWTDTDPETVFSNLKKESDYYNYHRLTVPSFFSEAKRKGLGPTISRRLAWGRMNMSPSDISDVSGATYTYLLNGNAPNTNWTGLFQPGEKIRLRVINGSSMTFFDVRIPGLKMTVVQADGNDVEPVAVDEFRIGVAERYDVIVQPQDNAAYTIFAQAEDRTDFRARYACLQDGHDRRSPSDGSSSRAHHDGYGHGQYVRRGCHSFGGLLLPAFRICQPTRRLTHQPAGTGHRHAVARCFVDRRAPEAKNPIDATDANLIAGMKIYQTNCASCHGDIHQPRGMLADALYPRAPQFVKDAPDMPENQNFYIIQHGIRLSGMPAWKQILSGRQMC